MNRSYAAAGTAKLIAEIYASSHAQRCDRILDRRRLKPDHLPVMPPPAEATSAWEQRAVSCGVAFVVLFVVGLVLGAAGTVDLDGTPAQVAASYDDNDTLLLASERVLVLAVFFFLAFVAGLGSALRRVEGLGGWLAGVAVAGGAAAGVLLLVAAGVAGVEVHEGVCAHDPSPSECSGAEGSLDPGSFSLLQALNFEFLVLSAIPLGILLAATAIVARRTPSIPRWLGAAAGTLAALFPLATIVKFAVFVLYVPFLAWVVLTSVILARRASQLSSVRPD